MADLSAFSSHSFNTAKWINSSLRDRADEDALESYLASLAMKLHIISQDYTDQLETGMVEAMSTMPKVLSEITLIEEGLKSVEMEMSGLASHLRTFDQRNVSGVEDLSRLDTLKSNMEKCNATLEEHARWSQVVREAKAILEGGGSLTDSADRIEIMFRSLDVLHNLPGHNERLETCQSLSETLLSALRPRVRTHILAVDLTPLHEYFYVYEKLGRVSELEEEYIAARPERLKPVWEKYSPSEPLTPWLAIFFGKVTSLLSEEYANSSALFGANCASDILSRLLEHALSPLAQPLSQRLLLEGSPPVALEAYVVAEEFSRRIVNFLQGCSVQRFLSVLGTIYGGFDGYLDCYGDKEGEHLRLQLDHNISSADLKAPFTSPLEIDDGDSGADYAQDEDVLQSFNMLAEQLVAIADNSFVPSATSIERAVAFMGGLRVKPALRSVAAAVANFTKLLTTKVDLLRVASGVSDRGGVVGSSNARGAAPLSQFDASAGSGEAYELALQWARKLESNDAQGKALVPSALRVLQATGRLCRRLRDLESLAVDRLSDLFNAIFRDMSLDRFQGSFLSKDKDTFIATADEESVSASHPNLLNQSSLGTVYACNVLQSEPGVAAELRSFLTACSTHHTSQTVFASTSAPLSRLKASAGILLFDICITNPEKILAESFSDDIWDSGSSSASGEYNSQLPRLAITQVGEHLLSLVQELEIFASSDALSDLLMLSGEATNQFFAVRGWRQLKAVLDVNEDEGIEQFCKRPTCASAISTAEKAMFGMQLSRLSDETTADSETASFGDAVSSDTPEDEDAAALSFVNEWLGAITDATIGILLVQIAQIQSLSPQGRDQLVVDIEYISNVIQAMGLRQHPILFHLRHILLRDPQTLGGAIDVMTGRSPVLTALQRFDRKVVHAILRGFGLSVATDTNANAPVPSVEAPHPPAGAPTGSETVNATNSSNTIAESEAATADSASTAASAESTIEPINDTTATSD